MMCMFPDQLFCLDVGAGPGITGENKQFYSELCEAKLWKKQEERERERERERESSSSSVSSFESHSYELWENDPTKID